MSHPSHVVLEPIEHPRPLTVRAFYWLSRRALGKVLTPFKVIYARKPVLAMLAGGLTWIRERHLSLEPSLRVLVQAQASRLNGCSFCHDLTLAQSIRQRIGTERFRDLENYQTSPVFSSRERAALALVEEATTRRHVRDDTWAAVRRHFSEKEIVELVWLNASENYFNLQAAVLRIGSDDLAALEDGQQPQRRGTTNR